MTPALTTLATPPAPAPTKPRTPPPARKVEVASTVIVPPARIRSPSDVKDDRFDRSIVFQPVMRRVPVEVVASKISASIPPGAPPPPIAVTPDRLASVSPRKVAVSLPAPAVNAPANVPPVIRKSSAPAPSVTAPVTGPAVSVTAWPFPPPAIAVAAGEAAVIVPLLVKARVPPVRSTTGAAVLVETSAPPLLSDAAGPATTAEPPWTLSTDTRPVSAAVPVVFSRTPVAPTPVAVIARPSPSVRSPAVTAPPVPAKVNPLLFAPAAVIVPVDAGSSATAVRTADPDPFATTVVPFNRIAAESAAFSMPLPVPPLATVPAPSVSAPAPTSTRMPLAVPPPVNEPALFTDPPFTKRSAATPSPTDTAPVSVPASVEPAPSTRMPVPDVIVIAPLLVNDPPAVIRAPVPLPARMPLWIAVVPAPATSMPTLFPPPIEIAPLLTTSAPVDPAMPIPSAPVKAIAPELVSCAPLRAI